MEEYKLWMFSTLKKMGIVILIILILISGYYITAHIITKSYTSPITIDQVTEVIRSKYTPDYPKTWEVKSVEKYEDGFTSSKVFIKYKNGAELRLYTSQGNWNFSKTYPNIERTAIGHKSVDYYFDEKSVAYVFNSYGMSYAIIAPKELESEVLEYIEPISGR